jgi:hypothetical protein
MPSPLCTQCLLLFAGYCAECHQHCHVNHSCIIQDAPHNFLDLLYFGVAVCALCKGGVEIGPPIQICWVPVSKSNVVGGERQHVCTSGAASGHIQAWRCLPCMRNSPISVLHHNTDRLTNLQRVCILFLCIPRGGWHALCRHI